MRELQKAHSGVLMQEKNSRISLESVDALVQRSLLLDKPYRQDDTLSAACRACVKQDKLCIQDDSI